MVPGGTTAPVKFDSYGKFDPPKTSAGKSPYTSYGVGWPTKKEKSFEELFGNLNLGMFGD